MELKAEQIIKALECCQFRHIKKNCDGCKYHRWIEPACRDLICQDALALITSQEQRIKELSEENERLHASCTELTRKMQDNVRAENEELRKSSECDMRKLKSDTVRKMKALIEVRSGMCAKNENGILTNRIYHLPEDILDQIAKEMLEESKP